MSQFVGCPLGKTFYSDNFGLSDNYTLFIAPKGFNQENNEDNHLMIYLRVLRLPMNIKKMTIRYCVKATFTTKSANNVHKMKESRSIRTGYGFNQSTRQCLVNRIPNIMLLSSLLIDIKIEIEEMIDMNNKVIPAEHWKKYGIDMNANHNFRKFKSIFA